MILVEESLNDQPKTKAQCLNCRLDGNWIMSIKVSVAKQTSFAVIDLCFDCRKELAIKLLESL